MNRCWWLNSTICWQNSTWSVGWDNPIIWLPHSPCSTKENQERMQESWGTSSAQDWQDGLGMTYMVNIKEYSCNRQGVRGAPLVWIIWESIHMPFYSPDICYSWWGGCSIFDDCWLLWKVMENWVWPQAFLHACTRLVCWIVLFCLVLWIWN